ncbi:hypothetical protein F5B20DRAFT_593489 [Whalleya microplaca]|nr:hypothetical protein F5B20DRAFT_593489 [Whalleya microplaca]
MYTIYQPLPFSFHNPVALEHHTPAPIHMSSDHHHRPTPRRVRPLDPPRRTTRFTGDGRVPLRERLQRMRDAAAAARGATEPPLTPLSPVFARPECPGAPAKAKLGKILDLEWFSSAGICINDDVDLLLDHRANKRETVVRRKLFLDLVNERRQAGSVEPGRASPLRNSVNVEEMEKLAHGLDSLREQEKEG